MKHKKKTMHDYAINTGSRSTATLACFAFALMLSFGVDKIVPGLKQAGADMLINMGWVDILVDLRFKAFVKLVCYLIPFSGFGLVYQLYDKAVWKFPLCRKLHKIPNLTGTWKAEVVSPLKGEKSEVKMTIRQNWNKLHVEGRSANGTKTDSYTASITMECKDNNPATITFSYAYYITAYGPEKKDAFGNMHRDTEQRYPGFNSLAYDVERDVLEGDYFSNKDITLRKDSDFMNFVSGLPNYAQLIEYMKGCGSKGKIRMERVSRKCQKQ